MLAAGAVLVTLVAAGCGASQTDYSAPSVATPATLPGQGPLDQQVQEMVLASGDVSGWSKSSQGAEKLSEQLTKPSLAGAKGVNQVIRSHWRASYHTLLRHNSTTLFSDANVFDSSSGAKQVWDIEQTFDPGYAVHTLPVPSEAPSGADYQWATDDGKRFIYEVKWRQGPVISLVFVIVDRRFTPAEAGTVGKLLGIAAAKQSVRVGKVLQEHAAALAAR
jgi:hypothetical protein